MARILRQKHINVFVMLGDNSYLSDIKEVFDKICSINCSYEIKRSIAIDRFYYIRIKINGNVDDIKQKIEKNLSEFSDKVFWYKIELIEVK